MFQDNCSVCFYQTFRWADQIVVLLEDAVPDPILQGIS